MKRTCSATLVLYTDSSSENEEETDAPKEKSSLPPPVKKRRLPTLAAHLAPTVPLDDPSRHQGRTRATPHVDGQWAAYIYVPILLHGKLRNIVERALTIARGEVASVHPLGGSGPDSDSVADVRELHISLTRPFFLHAHQREVMRRVVRDTAKAHSPFTASFAAFSDLTNDEHTRTFLCMEVGAGHQELRALSDTLTPALQSFRQKEYYDQPRFHASFAWVLLDRPAQASVSEAPEPLAPLAVAPWEDPTNGNESSFSTITCLPENIIPALNAELGSQLNGSAGIFEAGEVRIRIGKDVFSWGLSR
ncbi:hypothetical protein BJV78DRAFT_1219564 [Lactifluus subvellereus]|nr:hypothetical protein BJV78DRAFT_1219564 [Lactifluus subvellereus]